MTVARISTPQVPSCVLLPPRQAVPLPEEFVIPDEAEVILHLNREGVNGWPDYFLSPKLTLGETTRSSCFPRVGGTAYVRYGEGAPTNLWDLTLLDPPLLELTGIWEEDFVEDTVSIEFGQMA